MSIKKDINTIKNNIKKIVISGILAFIAIIIPYINIEIPQSITIILQIIFFVSSIAISWFLDSIRAENEKIETTELFNELSVKIKDVLEFSDEKNIEKQNLEINNLLDSFSLKLPKIFKDEKAIEPRDPEFSEFIAEFLLRKIQFNNGILNLEVVVQNLDLCKKIIQEKGTFNLIKDQGMSQIWLAVVNMNYETIGYVVDPFEDLNYLRSTHVFHTILKLLGMIQPDNKTIWLGSDEIGKFTFTGITTYDLNEKLNKLTLHIDARELF